jgi:hypothetical protein
MALFRVDYSGRGELSERQQKLAQMLSKLTKLSEEYNVQSFKGIFIAHELTSPPLRSLFCSLIKFNLTPVQP